MNQPILIDVRERDEFEAEHVAGSVSLPLSQFQSCAPEVLEKFSGCEIAILCRSGNRAKLALSQIEALGLKQQIKAAVYEGGILAWKKKGLKTIQKKKTHLPVMRQVQLIAGLSVLMASLGALFIDPKWAWGSVVFGAGLTFAGATGYCGLALFLNRLPWNKA